MPCAAWLEGLGLEIDMSWDMAQTHTIMINFEKEMKIFTTTGEYLLDRIQEVENWKDNSFTLLVKLLGLVVYLFHVTDIYFYLFFKPEKLEYIKK